MVFCHITCSICRVGADVVVPSRGFLQRYCCSGGARAGGRCPNDAAAA